MPDRLIELKRQRVLIAEHLLWIDREISAWEPEQNADTAAPSSLPPHPPVPAPPAFPADFAASAEDRPDPALTILQEAERQRGQISKSGCWIAFATLLLIGVGAITTYILVRYR